MKIIIIVILALVILIPPLLMLLLSATPDVTLDPSLTALGTETPVKIHITASHGVRRIMAWVEQNGARNQVYDTSRPSTYTVLFKRVKPEEASFNAGTKSAAGLKDGKAQLIVEITSNDLLGKTARAARDVNIITRPPSITADGAEHYINQGGAELVTFTVQGFFTEAGEKNGAYTFRSFPVNGKQDQRFSLFVFPWDLPAGITPLVYAVNPAGNQAIGHFAYKVLPRKFRKRDLDIDDAFLNKVVNEIDPNGSGDLVARFLKINGEMRRANNKTLAGLREKSEQRFLWTAPFLRMNAKAESNFADDRSYIYHGKKIDEQTHLGFDLSNVKNTPIPAANDGKVLFAERLGIYGNCIVVDHGYGLQSIYGHLNQINVKAGDTVKRGQTMGLSGATGLAGGDHLHFSMQIDGVQTNPMEWWDEHWIRDRIFSKMGQSAPR